MTTTILFIDMDDQLEDDEETGGNCPLATIDPELNAANKDRARVAGYYGPENPAEDNPGFWARKADLLDVTSAEAMTYRCLNCAGFNQSSAMLDCLEEGGPVSADEGFCEIWDFKCAGSRTCDAWAAGGPITDETEDEEYY
jgi:hypothetical protein